MKETELKPICINLTAEGEKRVSEAFTDLVKGFDEIQSAKFDKWLKEYCEGRADNEQREAER